MFAINIENFTKMIYFKVFLLFTVSLVMNMKKYLKKKN